jgi:hypothetical protein
MSVAKKNTIKCCECKYGIPTSDTEKSLYCDSPEFSAMITAKWRENGAKTSLASAKTHGRNFSCGYGRLWNETVAEDTR